ncbi:antibiotic biosynthesis monooxygenase [Novosphingobium sp. 2580]|uniref:Antibiotic biosynthesis monooxygenase n=1 Tax=Novosphingobium album (ex Hu et al. 2023) TaxID=2930093 RepID=A0ABT0B073_9SPHN|nr:antibiotic biosynthesis monooxygenase [Novosphingobium album (ex Hu et al. 2023)]
MATVRLHPERASEYEAALADIMPKVRAANPGVLFYHAGKCREEPDTYRVVEAYAGQDAMDRHIGSESLQQSLAGLMPMIADLDIRIHDCVA